MWLGRQADYVFILRRFLVASIPPTYRATTPIRRYWTTCSEILCMFDTIAWSADCLLYRFAVAKTNGVNTLLLQVDMLWLRTISAVQYFSSTRIYM